jgi:hypothetical protein
MPAGLKSRTESGRDQEDAHRSVLWRASDWLSPPRPGGRLWKRAERASDWLSGHPQGPRQVGSF